MTPKPRGAFDRGFEPGSTMIRFVCSEDHPGGLVEGGLEVQSWRSGDQAGFLGIFSVALQI